MSKKKKSLWGILIFIILAFGSSGIIAEEEPKPEDPVNKLIDSENEQENVEKKDAEEEAKRQAEEEAKRQAEEEAKRQAEEEAKRQAEEEAKRQAEEEAKRQAEEEAKRQAEEEAKRQAEEEANRAVSTPQSFQNCTAMRAVHPNGVGASHPAYESKHDRDKDGWACE